MPASSRCRFLLHIHQDRQPCIGDVRLAVDLDRDLLQTVITTYGRDLATTSTLYQRKQSGRQGRQSQTWLRTPDGWRVAAAHVSLLPD